MYCRELIKGKKWVCVADGPRDPATGRRKQISRRGKSQKEAKAKVLAAIEEIDHNLIYDPNITFKDFAYQWFEQYLLKGQKESTYAIREYCIEVLIKYIGSLKMKSVTLTHYQKILNDLFKKEQSLNTMKMIHTTARMIFRYATEINLIKSNPTLNAEIPKKQKTVEDIENDNVSEKYLETEELWELLNAADKYYNYVNVIAIYTIAFSGMRPGEAIALKEKDVLFESNQLSITKTIYRKKNLKKVFKLTPPKNTTSIRLIDMEERIMNMIKNVLEYKEKHHFTKSDHVFSTPDGYPIKEEYLAKALNEIRATTPIKKKLYPYILRHTHISMLAEKGFSLPFIMKQVGHKNSDTTTQIYMHVTKGMREQVQEKVGELFNDLMDFKKK
ncbi:tyrosine-type recombinase/integrase [Psychrobacillus lasiicapitis]|uniref:Site-specific integrase n=1 Tax=Psychrobacillus lasiicapitis TaxID=1636719 RepID=A0A544TAP5_9BACI|nr:site-specific integrase [Psychrobacillus lasiicapitis]TQR14428.1 site-specific integrase [Psychrobacillus lasiicapitis]GGA31421.1 prophage ps2 probable integrase [Psychrobacillus lasiicapitis]